ncbi:hypothetical protein BJY52DRAFT_1331232 [Lactarius psammicola]|nr:hypothetical protein BJY52DRAFT_1331232 [Lactarius psammicola]
MPQLLPALLRCHLPLIQQSKHFLRSSLLLGLPPVNPIPGDSFKFNRNRSNCSRSRLQTRRRNVWLENSPHPNSTPNTTTMAVCRPFLPPPTHLPKCAGCRRSVTGARLIRRAPAGILVFPTFPPLFLIPPWTHLPRHPTLLLCFSRTESATTRPGFLLIVPLHYMQILFYPGFLHRLLTLTLILHHHLPRKTASCHPQTFHSTPYINTS